MNRPTSSPTHGWENTQGMSQVGLSQANRSDRPRKLKAPEEVPHPSHYPMVFNADSWLNTRRFRT